VNIVDSENTQKLSNEYVISVGDIVEGEVTNITKFGAFVRIKEGYEGLVHISEISNEFVTDISKYVNVGDKISVRILAASEKNKLELSIKKAKQQEKDPVLFLKKKTKNSVFEEMMVSFLKRSEEKQIDLRRNLKNKQGITKKRK